MKRFVGLFVAVVFAISTSMVYGAPLKSEIYIYGKGGTTVFPDGVMVICPEPAPILCAVLSPCGGGDEEPVPGNLCRVQMQDGSNDVYEGTLLEIGENNQGAKIDPSTQCPEE